MGAIDNKKNTEEEVLRYKERNSIQDLNALTREQEKELYKIVEKNSLAHKLTIQSIIMLTGFFEGLINEIGSVELGQKYFGNNLDKLNILAKWEVVLRLVYGKSLNRESQ